MIAYVIFSAIRFVRYILDFVSDLWFGWLSEGKHLDLPPIRDSCILKPAHVLAQNIRRKELQSASVVRAYIRRIRDVQPIVNAIVDERFAEAIEEAIHIDEFLSQTEKTEDELANELPFLGVPVTIKEAIAVKGCLFTVGLPARRGLRAEFDSDATSLLKQAGAIPIAVTITPELCFWWESYNTLYGTCSNPYDTTRTAGGSSGGEGCILGSAGSVIGVGNDIGGSIRIPASFNGVFGHKPSRGAVSNAGEYPTADPALQSFLMTGPMCRYASDLLPMMKVLSVNHARRLKLDEKVDFKELKFYYMENDGNPFNSAVDPEILMAQRKLLQYFRDTYDVTTTQIKIPHMSQSFWIWSKVITTSGMQPIPYEMTNRKGNANLLLEFVKWCFGRSEHILPVLCSAALSKIFTPKDEKSATHIYKMMFDMEREFEKILGTQGVFIYPTGPNYAPYHGQALLKPFSVSYTGIFNLLGLPVSQCPVSCSHTGLPIGLQVVSAFNNDHLTIAVAEEIERAFGGWVPPPATK